MIRKARLSEAGRIIELINIGSKNGKALVRTADDIIDNIQNFFVWDDKRKIVGCCSLEVYSQKLAEIRSLVVLTQFQNQGIGDTLIRRCLEEAKKRGIYQVLAVTDRFKLFAMAGFKEKVNKKTPMFMILK